MKINRNNIIRDPHRFCEESRKALRLYAENLLTDKEFHDGINEAHYKLMGESFER